MITLLSIVVALSAVWLAVSDFKSRLVPLTGLILYFISAAALGMVHFGWYVFVVQATCNILLAGLIFLLLKIYFYVRYRVSSIIDEAIGKGDVLYLTISAFLFNQTTYIIFCIASCLVGLLYHIFDKRSEIPLITASFPSLIIFLVSS